MKKFIAMSAACAALAALSSCGGENKETVQEPVETATAWSDSIVTNNTGEPKGAEVVNYGEDGQIVSVTRYAIDKESKAAYKSDHIIYQNGKPAFGKSYRQDGVQDGRDIYTYNANGNIQEEVIELYNEGLKRIAPSQRYVYEYDANGDVVSVKEQAVNPKGWSTVYEWTYTYDGKQRLATRMDYTGEDKDRKQSCQYLYTYNENDNQLMQLDYYTFDLRTQKLKHDAKTRYEYNADGRVKIATVIRHKNNAKREDINSRQFVYHYNSKGQETFLQENRWNSNESKWFEQRQTSHEYNEAGTLMRRVEAYTSNKGQRTLVDEHYVTDGKGVMAPAGPVAVIKPVINLEDKHQTSKEEE